MAQSTTADQLDVIVPPTAVGQPTVVGQPDVAGQPDAAGWLVARDSFPQVNLPSAGTPGAMQDLIRLGGSN